MNQDLVQEGVCPNCKSEYIDYDLCEFEPAAVCYPATCNDCGCRWEEWYELQFSGQENIIISKQEQQ